MKRIRLKPCDDLDGGSDEMTEEIELRKRKDETLGTRIYSTGINSEGCDNHLDGIRIRFIVCLSFIKLN